MPVEKDDWTHEEAHLRIVRARVPKLLTQADLDRYLSLQEERSLLATEMLSRK